MLPGVQNKIKKTLWLITNNLYVSLMVKVKQLFINKKLICIQYLYAFYVVFQIKMKEICRIRDLI